MDNGNFGVGTPSSEWVAYQLFLKVTELEGRTATGPEGAPRTSRNLLLDAYADCLEAVKGKREVRRRVPVKVA